MDGATQAIRYPWETPPAPGDAVELADGTVGYGETLPREYVTGETQDSVIKTIASSMVAPMLAMRPSSFGEALEIIDTLPYRDEDERPATAARAGLELALIDAYARHFRKPISEIFGWLGLAGFSAVPARDHTRYSGVLSGDDLKRLPGSIRKMRCYGLRDFKLKVGYDDDTDRIRTAVRALGKSLGKSTTLRLDANGAWDLTRAKLVLTEAAALAR